MFKTYNSAWASLKIIGENLAYTLIPKKETGLLKFYNKSHFPMCQLNIMHILAWHFRALAIIYPQVRGCMAL